MGHVLRAIAALAMLASGLAFADGDGKTHLLWLAQSCFRITTPTGKVIVIDP